LLPKPALVLAVGAVVLMPALADADETAPVWFGGLPGAYPVLEDWDDASALPKAFSAAIGQKLYVLSPDGTATTGVLQAIEMAPDTCMFETSIAGLPKPVEDGVFLASAEPIRLAAARTIDPTDRRIIDGLARYLVARGIPAPSINVSRALEADLDGDGAQEAVVAAQSVGEHSPDDGAPVGHFSLVAAGKLTSKGFEVTTHAGYLTSAENPEDAANVGHYELLALPDFDHDGSFEMALYDQGYEWMSILIYAWEQKSLALKASASCGS